MKHRFLSVLLAAVICAALFPFSALAAETYETATIEQLRAFAASVNQGNDYSGVEVVLTADLQDNSDVVDSSGTLIEGSHHAWTPIGTRENPFRGMFNGNGHTVSGLYVNDSEADFQGLFGVISGASVYNVTVKDSYFNTRDHAGSVVGFARDGSVISSCNNDGTSIYTVNRAGGIVGWTDHSDVYNCSGNGYCYSIRCSGGIVGDVYSSGKIYNCYYAGDVEGNNLAGGITGGSTSADIQNCISLGNVSLYMLAGGSGSRSIQNSFALQNEKTNADKSIGSGNSTTKTFSGPGAVLNEPVEYNGVSYTTALDALNAWVAAHQSDGITYSVWKQKDLYPYLSEGVISSQTPDESASSATETSFGSKADDWAVSEMERAYEMELVPQVLVGQDLTRPITRSEFAAVAVKVFENLSGAKAVPVVVNPFTDTSDLEVLKAYQVGAVNGTSATTFTPDALLNREQCAAMLTRVFKRITLPGWTLDTDSQFRLDYKMPARFADDGEISDYARDSVYFMAANGIINGVGGNKFAPKNTTTAQEAQGYANATREQALAIAVRMVENLK